MPELYGKVEFVKNPAKIVECFTFDNWDYFRVQVVDEKTARLWIREHRTRCTEMETVKDSHIIEMLDDLYTNYRANCMKEVANG